MTLDSDKLRQTMRLWATGVTIVAAQHNDLPRATTVSSFTSVTLDPPLILVCLQKSTETAQVILDSGAFAVSMLGANQAEVSNLFAGYTDLPDDVDRFTQVTVEQAITGSPIIGGAMGWLDCRLYATHDGSTHHIFIGEVVKASGAGVHQQDPLLYHNRHYRQFTPLDDQ